MDFTNGVDRYGDADRMVAEGLALARRVGDRYWESSLLGHVYAKYALGLWDELMASLDEIPPGEFVTTRLGFNQGYVAFGAAVEVHGPRHGFPTERTSRASLASPARSASRRTPSLGAR